MLCLCRIQFVVNRLSTDCQMHRPARMALPGAFGPVAQACIHGCRHFPEDD